MCWSCRISKPQHDLQELVFMADAQTAGLVSVRGYVILTVRADTAAARRFSAACVLYAEALARDPASILPEPVE